MEPRDDYEKVVVKRGMDRALEYKKLMAEMGAYERNYIEMLEEEEGGKEEEPGLEEGPGPQSSMQSYLRLIYSYRSTR